MHTTAAAPAATTEAFAEYVAERRPALLRAARAITGDADTAEDLLQTALASVFVGWSRLRNPAAADAYVRRAMANQHASWWRQKWRTHEHCTDELPEHPTRSTDEQLDGADHQELWPLITALPPRQRSAVVLRYYEELSEAETAAALGCSVGTVKSSTSRGLSTLRRMAREGRPAALAN
jgi:RNA polymerase sigma-70 factor (sigma-E family)